jgi:hypothetical protein
VKTGNLGKIENQGFSLNDFDVKLVSNREM